MTENPEGHHPARADAGPDLVAIQAAMTAAPKEDAREYLRKQGVLADRQSVLVDLQIEI
jgi:hypothetical protein